MVITIYLVRHAKSIANEKRLFNSNIDKDLGLSGYGFKQAKRIADYFSNKKIDVIISSPFRRTIQTAEAISNMTGIKIIKVDEFREVDAGLWSGLTEDEIIRKYPKEWGKWKADPFTYPPIEGESVQDILDRVKPKFDEIISTNNRTIVIVTHYFVFNTLLCNLMGDLKQVRFFDTSNGTIAKITITDRARLAQFLTID